MENMLSKFRPSWLQGTGLLVILIFVSYSPVFKNSFIWDDYPYLINNPHLKDFQGLKRFWFDLVAMPQYHPLVFSSFWVEHKIWGFNPTGYHVTNVVIHCINACILWRILVLLKIKGSWLGASIFALHPVQVETVAWVVERKNLLSGLFFLSSIYAFLRFYDPSQTVRPAEDKFKHLVAYLVSLFLFLCALASKNVACTLPAVVLLFFWWKQNRLSKDVILFTMPYFVISLGYAFLTIWLEKFSAGAIGPEWELSFADRFLIAGRALWFYIGKLIFPIQLIFHYPRWIIDDSVWWLYLYPLIFLGLLFSLWLLRNKSGRGPLAGILLFSGTLFPALGFFNIFYMKYSFVADHWLYIPCIGMIILFSSGIGILLERGRAYRIFILLLCYISLLGATTWNQSHLYKDGTTLWRDTIRKNPGAWMAHNNLGNILVSEGKISEAVFSLREAIKIKPDFAFAHNNLGSALLVESNLDEAILHFRDAVRLKPDYAMAHNNLASALLAQGKNNEAIAHLIEAINMHPRLAPAHYNLGNALLGKGNTRHAIAHYKTSIEIDPGVASAHNNLGSALLTEGKTKEAIFYYKMAIKIKPDYDLARQNLDKALKKTGDESGELPER